MLGRKKLANFVIIRWWDCEPERLPHKKIAVNIKEIKSYKRRLFGLQNSPASFGFVSDAMELYGELQTKDSMDKKILLLVPKYEIEDLRPEDHIILWLSEEGKCYKIEKK